MDVKAQPAAYRGASARKRYSRARRPPFLVVFVTFLAAALAGCTTSTEPAPDFALVNQFGRTTRLADLKGRTVLLTFLYTHCPDTCPLYLSNIATALSMRSDGEGDRPVVVVVTVDPDRDTVEHLRAFSSTWPDDWLFLTGRYQEVASVWRSYRIAVRKQPLAHAHSSDVHEGYTVVHDGKLSIISGDGALVDELVGSWTVDDLRTSLHAVSDRRTTVLPRNPWPMVESFIRACGDFAAARPGLFVGLVLLAALPGLVLPVWLLWTFLRGTPRRMRAPSSAPPAPRK